MKSTNNLDLFRQSDAALARANRVAAEAVLYDPHFTQAERQQRSAHYIAEAERLEGKAGPVRAGTDRTTGGWIGQP